MFRNATIVLLAVGLLFGPGVAWGLMISGSYVGDGVFSGSGTGVGGRSISAQADFTVVDSDTLTIRLTNTAAFTDVNGNALTGLFWALPGLTLDPVSATIAASALLNPTACSSGLCFGTTNVGGEFRFDYGVSTGSTMPPGATMGLSSAGYIAHAGAGGNFEGLNLDGPINPSGPNFGIIGMTGLYRNKLPLIRGDVLFTFNYTFDGTLSEAMFTNVAFTYGTDLSAAPVPEPSTLLVVGSCFALLGARAWRRNRNR